MCCFQSTVLDSIWGQSGVWLYSKSRFSLITSGHTLSHCWPTVCVSKYFTAIYNQCRLYPPSSIFLSLSPVCIQLEAYLRAYTPTGCGQRAWAPPSRPYSSPTRTMRPWSSNVWSQAACLRTPVSLLSLPPWASKNWPPTPPRRGMWSGWGPRWENLRGYLQPHNTEWKTQKYLTMTLGLALRDNLMFWPLLVLTRP